MSVSEKSNLFWQVGQWQRQFGEWWELQAIKLGEKASNSNWNWLNAQTIKTIAEAIFWLLVGLILIWVTLKFISLIEPYFTKFQSNLNVRGQNLERGVPEILSVNAWLERSQKFKQQKQYREACFCLYQAVLQQLNDRAIIASEISRTDREYLKLTKYLPQANYYQVIFQIHQQLCFSEVEARLETFERCEQAYDQIIK